jgi:hypothetical protein
MKQAEALLELSMLNSESTLADFTDMKVELLNKGIPAEFITRMEELWHSTKIIAGELVSIGKIIIQKIYAFTIENTHLATGLALGAALGALVSLIPFLGPLLSPLVTALGLIAGALYGAKLDHPKHKKIEAVIVSAKSIFKLFAEIFLALKEYWNTKKDV